MKQYSHIKEKYTGISNNKRKKQWILTVWDLDIIVQNILSVIQSRGQSKRSLGVINQ